LNIQLLSSLLVLKFRRSLFNRTKWSRIAVALAISPNA